jgi:hypothetical protein
MDAPANSRDDLDHRVSGGYFYILATLAATELPAVGRLTASAITLPGEFRLTRLVLQ